MTRSHFSNDHEEILVYARRKRPGVVDRLERSDEHNKYYTNPDGDPRGPWNSVVATSNKSADERPNLYYPITQPNTGEEVWPARRSSWKYSKDSMQKLIDDNQLYWGSDGRSSTPRIKKFLSGAGKVVPRNVLKYQMYGSTQSGKTEFRDLMGDAPFDYPKPSKLIEGLLALIPKNEEPTIVLDFFAGSGATAQAVLQKTAQDGEERHFILVQLDEHLRSESGEDDYGTIADIARERIRRTGRKLVDQAGLMDEKQDIGFRSLTVDTTNMTDVLRSPDETNQLALGELEGSVKAGRSGEDLLFQVLLDWGLELTMPLSVEQIDGNEVFLAEDDALIAYFGDAVSPQLVHGIAKRQPLRAVFRDSGFASDDARINAEQIFREVSPVTDVKTI